MAAVALPSASALCLHCASVIPTSDTAPFCCSGCRAVHELLSTEHLERYYDLRGPRGVPVQDGGRARRDTKWLDVIDAKRRVIGGVSRVDLDVQGLHCSACVWLIERVFERQPGGTAVHVNPSVGRVQLVVTPTFDLPRFVSDLERFGYLFGPALKDGVRRSSDLVWRLGVCMAIAMNTMIFAIATYAGLREGPLHDTFLRINLTLGAVSVAVGGSVFFRSAWQGLRRGYLHLDLPIALGIGLAFAGSAYGYVHHRGDGIYVDTLNVFIALMLVGRWLQERVLERNRFTLLQNDGTDGLLARRIRDGRAETVRCTTLAKGDQLLIASGDLVPADAILTTREKRGFSLDWINGESAPRAFEPGDVVPAGAFLGSTEPAEVVLTDDFERSPLVELLRTPLSRRADAAMSTPWWSRLAKVYVFCVLASATVGFLGWWCTTHDLGRSLEVTTAVLIVTCPCAFGIATPLAYDLVLAGLRRAGLFVRSPGFLDRAAQVTQVVFDKTGTLTQGTLDVSTKTGVASLDAEARLALATMAASSSHPKSAAVLRALGDAPLDIRTGVLAEHPGRGIELERNGITWRLGAPDWVSKAAALGGDVAFGKDGALLASFTTEETLRPDARREVQALRDRGYDVWLLSGDDAAHVAQAAHTAGIDPKCAIGAQSAQKKAAWVAAHDHGDLLMIGDGINDSLVVAEATCGGTPAIDRPFLAARSDFYFVTPGLRPIRLALAAAHRLGAVRRRNLGLALAYNVLSVSLAYAGLMSPLACAVLMPLSSLTTVMTTTLSLSPRSSLWKS